MDNITDPVLDKIDLEIQDLRPNQSVPVKTKMLYILARGGDMCSAPYAVHGRSAFYGGSKIAERIVLDGYAYYFICTIRPSTPLSASVCASLKELIMDRDTYRHVLEVPREMELDDSTPQAYFESLCSSYSALAEFKTVNAKLISERKHLGCSLNKIRMSDELRRAITVSEKNKQIMDGAIALFRALEELEWNYT